MSMVTMPFSPATILTFSSAASVVHSMSYLVSPMVTTLTSSKSRRTLPALSLYMVFRYAAAEARGLLVSTGSVGVASCTQPANRPRHIASISAIAINFFMSNSFLSFNEQ